MNGGYKRFGVCHNTYHIHYGFKEFSATVYTNSLFISVYSWFKCMFLMMSYLTILLSSTTNSASSIPLYSMYPSGSNSVNKNNPILLTINEELQPGSRIGRLHDLIHPRPDSSVKFVIPQNPYFTIDADGVVVIHGPIDRDNNRQLCSEPSYPEECVWTSVAIGTNGQYIALRITIKDINDNVPAWSEQFITVQVTEELKTKFSAELPLASDPDMGQNGIQQYKLQEEGDHTRYFRLQVFKEPTKTATYRFRLFLHIVASLDREECPMFNLTLLASDGSKPFHTGTVNIRVIVLDENDHSPQFTSQSYVAIVQEDATVGSEVLLFGRNDTDRQSDVGIHYSSSPVAQKTNERFLALDRDSGSNGEIEYSFAASTDPNILKTFSLDKQSGVLRIVNPLSYDSGPREWQFKLFATDHGRPPRSSSTEVSIKLIDANTHAPDIKVRTQIPKAYRTHIEQARSTKSSSHLDPDQLYIPENVSPTNDALAVVTVSDRDVGPGGLVDCQLTRERDTNQNTVQFGGMLVKPTTDVLTDYFRLSFTDSLPKWNVYSLFLQKSLDRENMLERTLLIQCTDQGTPAKSSTARIFLNIVDQNDNAPKFMQLAYRINVLEGNRPNAAIAKLIATDPDEGDNGRITYELSTSSLSEDKINETFQITDTGILIALKSLDREATPDGYKFKVIATDNGSPKRLSSVTDVHIVLDDVNDCTPVFMQKQYNFTLFEDYAQNFTAQRRIGAVKATDCDLGENGKVSYAILDPGLPFEITNDGILRTSRLIDRELRSVYRFTVLAKDGGVGQHRFDRYTTLQTDFEIHGEDVTRAVNQHKYRTSATQVRVTIEDLNDNYPIFVYPNSSSLKVHVSSQESRGFVVSRLVALDKDSGPNGQVQYRIVRANVSHGFKLRRGTGELYVDKDMTNENVGTIEFFIEASDQGNPPQKNSIQLYVSVNNMPPVGRNMLLGTQSGLLNFEKDVDNQSGTIEINKLIVLCIVISTTVVCIIMMFVIGLCVRRTSCYRLRRSHCAQPNRSGITWRAQNGKKEQVTGVKDNNHLSKEFDICENLQTAFQPIITRPISSSPCTLTTESSKLLTEGDTINLPLANESFCNSIHEDPTISNNYVDVIRSEAGNVLTKPGFLRVPSDLVSCHLEQNQRVYDPNKQLCQTSMQLSPATEFSTNHPLTVSVEGHPNQRCVVHLDTSTGVGYLAIPVSSTQNQVDSNYPTSSFTRNKYFLQHPSQALPMSQQHFHHPDLHVLDSDVDSGRGGSVVNIGLSSVNTETVISNSVLDNQLLNVTPPNSLQTTAVPDVQQPILDVPINYLPGQLSLITVDGQLCVLAPPTIVPPTNTIFVTTNAPASDPQALRQLDLIQPSTPIKTVSRVLECPTAESATTTQTTQPRSTSVNSLSSLVEHKTTTNSPWRLIDLPP